MRFRSKFFGNAIYEHLFLCKDLRSLLAIPGGFKRGLLSCSGNRSIKLHDGKVFRNHKHWRYFFLCFSENSIKSRVIDGQTGPFLLRKYLLTLITTLKHKLYCRHKIFHDISRVYYVNR